MDHDGFARLAGCVRATAAEMRTVERVGPFLATFTERDADPCLI
ncbi:MAG TPA: hypothetical protein VED84_03995 [Acidimicrobiales bacterium]|nr:hypothetical protein [Acidimicrobiales bacterium]